MTSNDYNRTHDPLLRGWTRKQPARRGRGGRRAHLVLLIAGVLLLSVLAVLLAMLGPSPAHGQGQGGEPSGDPGVVCAAAPQLTICPPAIEAVTPRAFLPLIYTQPQPQQGQGQEADTP